MRVLNLSNMYARVCHVIYFEKINRTALDGNGYLSEIRRVMLLNLKLLKPQLFRSYHFLLDILVTIFLLNQTKPDLSRNIPLQNVRLLAKMVLRLINLLANHSSCSFQIAQWLSTWTQDVLPSSSSVY